MTHNRALHLLASALGRFVQAGLLDLATVAPFAVAIRAGSLAYGGGIRPSQWVKPPPSLFTFLSDYVTQWPSEAASVIPPILTWFFCPVECALEVLGMMDAAVNAGTFTEDWAALLASTAKTLLAEFPEKDYPPLIVVTNLLADLAEKFPYNLGLLDDVIEKYADFTSDFCRGSFDSESEYSHSDDPPHASDLMPYVTRFLAEVYGNKKIGAPLDRKWLKRIVKRLDPDWPTDVAHVIDALLPIALRGDEFEFITQPIAKVSVGLLLDGSERLKEDERSERVLDKMKQAVKQICAAHPNVKANLTESFESDDERLQRFLSLIQ
jgi:hypothetical protein